LKVDTVRTWKSDVPLLESRIDAPKKLIFIQHGIFGNKDKVSRLLAPFLNRLGYQVVALDAKKHGERAESPFKERNKIESELQLFDIVDATAKDIVYLFEHHYDFDRFDVLGVSMGGYVAYRTAMLSDVDVLAALISGPDFTRSAFQGFTDEDYAEHSERIEAARRRIATMDPSRHSEALSFRKAIALCGERDQVIPPVDAEDVLASHDVIFRTFDTGHRITKEMHDALIDLLKREI